MNPLTHLLIGWSAANIDSLEHRDRVLVTIGGVLPDIDAFGTLPEIISGGKIDWYSRYHHILVHNLTAAVCGTLLVFLLALKRLATALLFLGVFHLHLLGDILGARGPDGYQWPIPYLWPFSERLQLVWSGQWRLDSWQNLAITLVFLILAFWLARVKSYSPVGLISRRLDNAVVTTIRHHFPLK